MIARGFVPPFPFAAAARALISARTAAMEISRAEQVWARDGTYGRLPVAISAARAMRPCRLSLRCLTPRPMTGLEPLPVGGRVVTALTDSFRAAISISVLLRALS